MHPNGFTSIYILLLLIFHGRYDVDSFNSLNSKYYSTKPNNLIPCSKVFIYCYFQDIAASCFQRKKIFKIYIHTENTEVSPDNDPLKVFLF